MTYPNPTPGTETFPATIPRIEVGDVALGGNLTNSPNRQIYDLLLRTAWLKRALDNSNIPLEGLDADLKAIAALTGTGFLERTGVEAWQVRPQASVPVFGGRGSEGDVNISTTVTMNGSRYVNDFIVQSTGTVNATQGYLYIKAARDIIINGAINVTAVVANERGFSGSVGAGYLFPGAVNAGSPPAYPFQMTNGLGAGGFSGWCRVGSAGGANVFIPSGGNGGGGLFLEAGRNIEIRGTITADGAAASAPTVSSPQNSTPVEVAGASGGTGGTIWLAALTSIRLFNTAILRARAGASSAATRVNSTVGIFGAGGSAGGYVLLASPTRTLDSGHQILVTGAAAAAGFADTGSGIVGAVPGASFGGQGGSAGAAGSAGQIITQSFIPL